MLGLPPSRNVVRIEIMTMSERFHLRFHDQSCANCRYFRIHTTGASDSECLALGRTLGTTRQNDISTLLGWARERLCELWAKRPRNWNIYSDGVDHNPHWVDPYIPREVTARRTVRLLRSSRKDAVC